MLRCFQAGLSFGLALGLVWSGVVSAQEWTRVTPPGLYCFHFIVSSSSGSNLFTGDPQSWQLIRSADGGASWAPPDPSRWVSSLACSADGQILAAVAGSAGSPGYPLIYRSTDGGTNWTATSSPATNWSCLASSADGTTYLAGLGYPGGTGIYVSSDSGQTWTRSPAPDAWWASVACSADARRMLAASAAGIYLSTNSGLTWDLTSAPVRNWESIACSADATSIAAKCSYPYQVFTSTNLGASWSEFTPAERVEPYGNVAISASGERIVAIASGIGRDPTPTLAFISTNRGASWYPTQLPGDSNVTAVASSADGCSLAAIDRGAVYQYRVTPHPVLDVAAMADDVLVSWVVPSRTFVLQENAGLDLANWGDVAQTPILNYTNLQYQVRPPRSAGNRFYRLLARP